MKQICLHCRRMAANQSIYCPELDCPAERAPYLFERGEWMEDLEILHLVAVLRTATLYTAQQHGKTVLLKVAHPGGTNVERLKRETAFLATLPADHPQRCLLPYLLPPYLGATTDEDLYGATIVHDHLVHFALFAAAEGESLGLLLQQHAPLWINDAGWIAMQLADALGLMHDHGALHLSLTPESLLIRRDGSNMPRILLWDLGSVWAYAQDDSSSTVDRETACTPAVSPAYLAPELDQLQGKIPTPSPATDVYGIGVVFFETLVGKPMYANAMRSDLSISRDVRTAQRHLMTRKVDAVDLAALVQKSVDPSPSHRQQTTDDLAGELQKLYGALPPEATQWQRLAGLFSSVVNPSRTAWAFALALLAVIGLVLYVLWQQ